MEGYIKLHKKIINWQWYDDINTKVVFLHLLLTANYEDKKWHNIIVKRGQRVISYENLAKETSLTTQAVRTAIFKLKSTGEITVKRYPKFQVISIVNYGYYQDKSTGKSTPNQQAVNIQLTVNQQQLKNNKNVKKEKKEYALSGDDDFKIDFPLSKSGMDF